MNQFMDSFYGDGSLLVLWGAIILNWLLPIPRQSNLFVLWQKFGLILSDKVNKPDSYQQNLLSGTLACLLMWLPAIILLIALYPLVWRSELFDLALLILALDFRNLRQLSAALIDQLSNEDKLKSRAVLADWLNRKTKTLSLVGIGKAGAETMLIGHARSIICVLFWYGLLGGIGALAYRILAELHRVWSPSRAEFKPFGTFTFRLLSLVEIVPVTLFSILLLLGKDTLSHLRLILLQSSSWTSTHMGYLLAITGVKFNLSLGGPALYGTQKSVRSKLGGRVAPSSYHLSLIQRFITIRVFIWIVLQSIIMFLIHKGF
ncbi:cobalamin biosynthesis family protein [Vibrio sp.]|uniref:Cobalamin biosynthesis family protein n=1 Tax=Vibrio viridaestus TaxID=2487322 RepID=A0A3N9TGF6_9VIBR|nr:cobalamin biosynthesis family protein [Vibrio viridaestus]MDC0609300.1 cobalamin biosynthesis family protein [Vibrio sp.]RQW62984.1 cobalamin biosynthesis family protein [Vibrio viridaestus]